MKRATARNDPPFSLFSFALYFAAVCFFTVVFNIVNKEILSLVQLPLSLVTIQLFIGIMMFLPYWLISGPPEQWKTITAKSYLLTSLTNSCGIIATILAIGSGSVSFFHVVKCAEPVFTAVFSALILGQIFSWQVYFSLIPIIFGVAVAGATEISFTWFGFSLAITSNFMYQLRIVLTKYLITGKNNNSDPNVSAADFFRILTIFSFFELFPFTCFIEGGVIIERLNMSIENGTNPTYLGLMILLSGFSYYTYSEISFWILGLVAPITVAVCNTLKRVAVIFSAIAFFHNPVTIQGLTGSTVAICGSFLYALVQNRKGLIRKSNVENFDPLSEKELLGSDIL